MKILNKKIHLHLAASVTSAALILSLMTSAVLFYISYQQEVERSREQINHLISHVKKSASMSLYRKNEEMMQEVILELKNNNLISDAKLSPKKSLSGPLGSKYYSKMPETALIFPLYSPFDKTDLQGNLLVYPDQTIIEDNAFALAQSHVMILLLYAISISLLTLIIVNRILTDPMKHIATRFHLISPGDTARLIIPKAHQENEIGNLVRDINQLLNSVNDKINNEQKLRIETDALARKFRLIFEHASAGIGLLNSQNQLIVANPALLRLIGQTFIVDAERFSKIDFTNHFFDPIEIKEFIDDFLGHSGSKFSAIDIQLRHKVRLPDKWVHCLFSKVEDINDPDNSLIEVVIYDITERAEREQNIIYDAEHDPLTLLLNRRASMIKLEQSIIDSEKKDRNFALFMIDLDGFKTVNDIHGHEAGDKVIAAVAFRIKQFFRGTDVVSRWGGDEFLIGFSYNPNYETAVTDIVSDLQHQINLPIDIGDEKTTKVGSSIGIAFFPEHEKAIGPLIEKADEAMYFVKKNGKNFFHIYQSALAPVLNIPVVLEDASKQQARECP